jgi:hypothetical protein
LSKLGAQALVLLSASHSYSSAVGPVVRPSCPAPDGKGRFVIRAIRELWGWRATRPELDGGNS